MNEEKKHEGGRPLKFSTPEEMQEKIDAYFAECEVKEKPKTMCGLALALGIDRKTLCNYSNKDEFFHTIKEARQIVEGQNEEMLISGKGSATGIIFNLKNNFGWVDKSEVDNNVAIRKVQIEFDDGDNQDKS